MTMFEASKIQKPGAPKPHSQQPQQKQQVQPGAQQHGGNNGPSAELKKEPSSKTQL